MAKKITYVSADKDDSGNIFIRWSIEDTSSKQMSWEEKSAVYKAEELESAVSKVAELTREKLTSKK